SGRVAWRAWTRAAVTEPTADRNAVGRTPRDSVRRRRASHASRSVGPSEARPTAERGAADAGGDQRQEHLGIARLRKARGGVQRLGLPGEIAAAGHDDHRDARERRILQLLHAELEPVHHWE